MRTDNRDWIEPPPDRRGKGRDYGKRSGACFTRVEAVGRAIAFSCTPVLWRRWAR